ncbi:MAG: EAL domain-containing protein [Hyphomicrobiales bacterium]|nr:EAL domain-containing protein [Hyphomicrobiales bacterium]
MPDGCTRKGVSFDDLTLHYQPQVSADGTRVVAVEALLRLSRPTPRLATPADVLAYFEAPEDAAALDWWVFRRAAIDALRWPTLTVSLNLTAERFRDPTFAPAALALIEEIGVDPRRIELEIVEGAYIEDFETAVANIRALRDRGVRIALDDFGTGFSSLTYLLKLPVDKVKIDKSFVDGVGFVQSAAIVHSVVALGRALGLKLTAEGVESEDQWRFLRAAGCHYLQGWLFAKALPAEAIDELMASGVAPRGLAA